MKIKIVRIGNSKGIRIPKVLLRQTGIDEEVSLEVKNNQIILTPVDHPARRGWSTAFAQMHTVDKVRLIKKLGRIDKNSGTKVLSVLQEMFLP